MSAPAFNTPAAIAQPISTPVIAWRMHNALHACSLHHERTRAEQAAVDHHGLVSELIELTPELRTLVGLHNAAVMWLDSASPADPLLLAAEIAARAVHEDIEDMADQVNLDGTTWHDVTPMLSEHEHAPDVLEMCRQTIAYGLVAGLIRQHTARPRLVRLIKR